MPTCRFAPSPNGPLHLGHAYSALRNSAVAARLGGRTLLRMENIDTVRCTPALELAIIDDLAWLGFAWGGTVLRQSEHVARYDAALDRLAARGLLYPCVCTRGDIARAVRGRPDWPHDPDGVPLYPGTCRGLGGTPGRPRIAAGGTSLRLDMARALATGEPPSDWAEFGETGQERRVPAHPAAWGDVILRRRDVPATYHVAVVVDDAAQGVTDVVRGRDLFAATSLHRLLQALLGLPAPRYHHHRLVLDLAGNKLSKSRGAPALAGLRASGATSADMRAMIAARLESERGDPEPTAYGSSVESQYR